MKIRKNIELFFKTLLTFHAFCAKIYIAEKTGGGAHVICRNYKTDRSGHQSSCRAFPTLPEKEAECFICLCLESVMLGAENSDGFSGWPDVNVGGKRLSENNFTVVMWEKQ